ncbi:nitrilase family protein (carbon-nitrogen hydrolase) [Colletotrichum tofieldiae]|uniref:Nitrilase family protein (Carbon-nitrogen hydrolase) n=1 Tax=Colletotrichum tofieldiae TaxID=708197 RepID=A0A166SZB2_9PEZI|nr:nitrilase family protein (carbon-nitrogen hydrolase) [Colletotrichum tofieldiae]
MLVFLREGILIGSHRKAHLFDIDMPGQMSFHESAITVVDLPEYGRVGLGICYDIRFPEMATIATRQGAFALIHLSAFNSTTGPLHWELLARSRALDNQLFVALCSQAFDECSGGYPAWGHSIIAGPNGEILATAGRGEDIVYTELDDDCIQRARRQIPTGSQKRFDIYPDINRLARNF